MFGVHCTGMAKCISQRPTCLPARAALSSSESAGLFPERGPAECLIMTGTRAKLCRLEASEQLRGYKMDLKPMLFYV